MKLVGIIIVFLLICAISAGLFLASIPALVHRITPELDQTLLILAGLLALAIVWWFVSGRRWAIAVLGWLVLVSHVLPCSGMLRYRQKISLHPIGYSYLYCETLFCVASNCAVEYG